MTAPELKPCPFCGAKANTNTQSGSEVVGYVSTVTVRCSTCGAGISAIDSRDANGWANASDAGQKAIAAWNTRTPAPDVAELVAALREASQRMSWFGDKVGCESARAAIAAREGK